MTDDVIDPSAGEPEPEVVRSQEPLDVARRLEAILLVVDEPQSLVSLAAAERYGRDPAGAPASTCYRTGDGARWRADRRMAGRQ